MKKPTILHTEASLGWGGQEIRILSEMLGMRSRNYEVLLATPSNSGIYQRATDSGFEVFDVKMDRTDFISGTLALKEIMKNRSISILNTHSSRDSWMGSIAGKLLGVKVLRTRHISSALNKNRLTRLVYGPLCDGIITTGELIRTQLINELSLNLDKIHSIPTGINVERFQTADGVSVRSTLRIPLDAVVLGIAAVLRSWKGHSHLLRAMPQILASYPEVKLMIVGDGPMRRRVEEELRDLNLGGSVILTGHREDIPEVVNSFDIAVIASYASEGIPQFALQAMAAGKPVIGTRIGGIPEVIQDGINGLLIDPQEPALIADAVKALLNDRERMKQMGEAGRRIVRDRHTAEKMLDCVEALYHRVLS